VLEAASDLGRWFNRVLSGWSNRRDLVGLIGWYLISVSKLSLIVHAPGIDVSSLRQRDGKLFSHLDIENNRLAL
jgi:hypothetical protein